MRQHQAWIEFLQGSYTHQLVRLLRDSRLRLGNTKHQQRVEERKEGKRSLHGGFYRGLQIATSVVSECEIVNLAKSRNRAEKAQKLNSESFLALSAGSYFKERSFN
jgi:hypothetical protein